MTTFRSGAVVAQVTVNHLVAGSNPAFGANFQTISFSFRSGAVVAQVTVNHLVAGSNPAFGAILRLSNCSGVFCFLGILI